MDEFIRTKDPDATLDYAWDFKAKSHAVPGATGDWLSPGERISEYSITAPAGITIDRHFEEDGRITVWLSGGTVRTMYRIICRINTSGGRRDDRTITIRCNNR